MSEIDKSNDVSLDSIHLVEAYSDIFSFVKRFIGQKKALEFSLESYEYTLQYFSPLSLIELNDQNKISFQNSKLGDPEILGFSLWMYQFVRKLKEFMVGVGQIDLSSILKSSYNLLAKAGFVEYFEQAREFSA